MEVEQNPIEISVLVLTYCHETYIAQALDSILTQKTDLRYEVLVGDDASLDQTAEIVLDYAQRYPHIIRPVLRLKNIGATRNGCDLFQRAKGRYIASLEGDDFWLDPNKLQKQWEFLETHKEYIGCCGKCLVVDEYGQPDYTRTPHFVWNKKIFTLEDMIESWNVPGQVGTRMIRNIFRNMKSEEYSIIYQAHPIVGDKSTYLLLLSRAPIYCSNDVLSCYRSVDKKGENNWFSIHHANPYRNYDMFMYPCRLETWARKNLGLSRHIHFGKRSKYRFCRFVEECVRKPSWKRLRYLAEMVRYSHQPAAYCRLIVKTLIEMEN